MAGSGAEKRQKVVNIIYKGSKQGKKLKEKNGKSYFKKNILQKT